METEKKKYDTGLGTITIILLIVSVALFVFAFFAPTIFTRPAEDGVGFSDTGEIGDTIGGLMSPFINLAAVIVTGLAFYMQYRANKLQVQIFTDQLEETRNQFKTEQEAQAAQSKLQQFESQFFEMLRLHKENVNEMNVEFTVWDANFENPKPIKVDKRQVFKEMNDFFYKILEQTFFFGEFTQTEFEAAYKLFFWGYNKHYYDILRRNNAPITNVNDQTDNLFKLLSNHNGYAYILAHYFRHLFLMVKFVDRSPIVTDYDERMKYLKILRAQLSNQEQILLFYNWLCEDYGSAWQEDDEDGNKFFTKYKMIHNLWHKELYPDNFFYKEINDLIHEHNKDPKETPLFEFQGKEPKFLLPIEENKPLAENFD